MNERKTLPYIQNTVAGGPFEYSRYEINLTSPFATGAVWTAKDGFAPIADAKIFLLDQGFVHSHVTYTVAGVWHGNFFRLGDHIDRLLDGAEKMHIASPLSKRDWMRRGHEVVALTQLREAYVSFTLTAGVGVADGSDIGFNTGPQAIVFAVPYRWVFPPAQQVAGISAAVPKLTRRNLRNQINPQVKNYQWGDLTEGLHEARQVGANTAILLDQNGWVAEGPGFNVLIVKDGCIATPAASALPGITRRSCLELAERAGIEAALRDVSAEELYNADEIFAATTAGGVTPIVQLDGRPVGTGQPGQVTVRIQREFWKLMDEESELVEPVDYGFKL
jgi:branched-chain amino acid aminotransferase